MIKLSIKEYNNLKKKIDIGVIDKKSKVKNNINIVNCIRDSTFEYKITESSISIVFYGAKLYSLNQIFALLQSRKYEIFKYKKEWHRKIKQVLEQISLTEKIPYFNEPVQITLYRGAKKLVDEDSLTTMFKYIIDSLKKNNTTNPNGVLSDDNQNVVSKILCYSSIEEPVIGIKIEKQIESKPKITAKDLLK